MCLILDADDVHPRSPVDSALVPSVSEEPTRKRPGEETG